MLVLALAGSAAFAYLTPVSLAIAVLLLIVIISYRQTIRAYPDGGGAFIVAHDNLGLQPAMVAAAALLTDYTLTVSVSVAAGVAAITSAFPVISDWRVEIAVGLVILLTLANLRGVKESSTLFAIPTYAFVVTVFVMLVTGFVECIDGECPQAISAGHRGGARGGRGQLVPHPPRVCLGFDRAHRGGGHRQRCAGVPRAPSAQRGKHVDGHGRHLDHDVPRDQHPGAALRRTHHRGDRRRVRHSSLSDRPGRLQRRARASGSSRSSRPGSSSWRPTPPIRISHASHRSWLGTNSCPVNSGIWATVSSSPTA